MRNLLRLCLVLLVGVSPTSARAQDAGAAYLTALTTHIVEHQKYPSSAKLYGLEGDVIISIQIDKKGNIANYRFIRDTQHPILHDGVIEILKASTPVPPPAAQFFGNNKLAEFMFPIAFRIGMKPESLVKVDQEFQSIILSLSQR